MSQVIKKAPALLANDSQVDLVGLFTAACGCLGLPENGPVKYSAQFLNHFIGISRESQNLLNVVNQHGSRLFQVRKQWRHRFIDTADITMARNCLFMHSLRIHLH